MFDPNIIRERALELNYEDCRIIGINDVNNYMENKCSKCN
jgi:hypothetical protein